MAGVLQPSIDWSNRSNTPLNHNNGAKSGFGFGLASSSRISPYSSPAPQPPTVSHQSASGSRASKRRLESDHTEENERDERMDRSPTPERPKRMAPKRARIAQVLDKNSKGDKESQDGRPQTSDVDIGVLLASLPPQSCLPLLIALVTKHPSVTPLLLPLIPRPTLETALQALSDSAKKLRDAYPYSMTSPALSFSASRGPGFGFGASSPSFFGAAVKSGGGGFGSFGSALGGSSSENASSSSNNGGMRESYVQSRLRPHVDEFVSTALSYIHYFSLVPEDQSNASPTLTPAARPPPPETFTLLSNLSMLVLSQPPIARDMLTPLLVPRLVTEWRAWLDKVDSTVNTDGGMFGSEVANSWARGLDQFAEVKVEGWEVMRQLRDAWVARVGWLVGRRLEGQRMEEEI